MRTPLLWLCTAGCLVAGAAWAGERRRVPDVVDLAEATAEAELSAAGFDVRKDDVPGEPIGTVAAQAPGGFAWADVGSPVRIAVRRGTVEAPAPAPPATAIPDVVGRTEGEALDLLRAWRVTVVPAEGGPVHEGRVLQQAPAAGTALEGGGEVVLHVARAGAPPPGTSVVPDVVGLDAEAATRVLTEARLVTLVNLEPSDPADAGRVVAQAPAAGRVVAFDSNVALTVGRPAQGALLDVEVPDVVGLAEAEARPRLAAAGLRVTVRDRLAPARRADSVLVQDPAAGSRIQRGRSVTLTVGRLLLLPVRVPDALGLAANEAEQGLKEAGFAVERSAVTAPSGSAGKVVAQEPAAGTTAIRGSTVRIAVGRTSAALPVSTPVPALVGKTEAQARADLSTLGLAMRIAYGPGSAKEMGRVKEQTPPAGSTLPRGSEVFVRVVGAGPSAAPEPLPSYVGGDAARAQAELTARGLAVSITYVTGTQEGRVVAQSPPPGTPLARGSQVSLTVVRAPTLPQVALAHPQNGFSVARSRGVTYAWAPVAEAEDYEFEILAWRDDTWVVADRDVVKGVEKRPSKVRKGTYQWHVRARRAGGKVVGPWSDWRRITLY